MGAIAIACNPQSGKDIRRLITTATIIDDTEKLNIVERIVISALKFGAQEIVQMPERFHYGARLEKKACIEDYPVDIKSHYKIYDMQTMETQEDTENFARAMCDEKVSVMIVMGGDGTNRVAAKKLGDVPLISVSTGTNNVFPEMLEGTVVGMAAAALSKGIVDVKECSRRAKQIEISKNGKPVDIALIDMVFCRDPFVGSRAIWVYEDIEGMVVTQCHPASIGFSALIGTSEIVKPEDDYGMSAFFNVADYNRTVPISAGSIRDIHIRDIAKAKLDAEYTRVMDYTGTLALDGEREITFNKGDTISYSVTRRGPIRVDVRAVLEKAMENGFFEKK